MEEQSSRFAPAKRRAAVAASVFGIAVFGVGAGVAVSGCGSDNNSNEQQRQQRDPVGTERALDCPGSQVSTAQQKGQSISTQVQSVQSQVQSVQSQISTAKSGGGYGY